MRTESLTVGELIEELSKLDPKLSMRVLMPGSLTGVYEVKTFRGKAVIWTHLDIKRKTRKW